MLIEREKKLERNNFQTNRAMLLTFNLKIKKTQLARSALTIDCDSSFEYEISK